MTAEGATLLICALSYLSLRSAVGRSPAVMPDPVPTIIQSLVMLASWPAMARLSRAASRFDRWSARRWLAVVAACGIGSLVLRGFELGALNVRWDASPYAALAWITVVVHSTVLALEVVETVWLAGVSFAGPMGEHRFAELGAKPAYWYFMTTSWIALGAMLYLVPWVL
jgi:heme/copper-type cytochrome/quinol oxidase subunit 3